MSTKYKVIAEDLRSQILLAKSLKPYKLPTEQELCRKYQVSRQTVRQALTTLEEEKLIKRRQGSGAYTIPQSEHLKEKKIVLLVSEENEYTYPAFISDIRSVLRIQGLTLTVCVTENNINIERSLLTEFLNQSISVLIIEGIQSAFSNPNIDLYEKMQLSGTQIVFINHDYPEIHNAACIQTEDVSGGCQLGEYLVANGFMNPAAILPDFSQNAKDRYFGLQTAYRDKQLSMPVQNIFWYSENDIRMLRLRQDTGFITDFIRRIVSKCDSILCYSDEIAYQLIKELSYAGYSVPSQISVVSFDNSYLCSLSRPPITSLGLPAHEPGYSLGNMIVDILHENKAENKTLPWKLFPRGSVLSLNTNYF